MSLQEIILNDLKTAMLAQDSRAVSVLRLLKSELTNARISEGKELSEDQVIQIIKRESKKRRETAELYRKAGEQERAEEEEKESEVLSKYLPEQISEEVIRAYLKDKLAESSNPQVGPLIKETLQHFQGQADGLQLRVKRFE